MYSTRGQEGAGGRAGALGRGQRKDWNSTCPIGFQHARGLYRVRHGARTMPPPGSLQPPPQPPNHKTAQPQVLELGPFDMTELQQGGSGETAGGATAPAGTQPTLSTAVWAPIVVENGEKVRSPGKGWGGVRGGKRGGGGGGSNFGGPVG